MNTTRVLAAGIVAGMAMGMIEMLYEAIAGQGFWSPMVFIAATILRDLQNVGSPVPFQFLPVVLGLMGHMMNSVILGAIFAALIASRLNGLGALVGGGVVYALAVFAIMWLMVLPLVDPAMLRLNGVVFAIAHVMWGGALGLALGWGESRVAEPRRRPAH